MKTPSKSALMSVLAVAALCGAAVRLTDRSSSPRPELHPSLSSEPRQLQSRTFCGCADCTTAVWTTEAPAGAGTDFTCGRRMKFLHATMSNIAACRQVADEFPEECGACDPDTCVRRRRNTAPPTAPGTVPPADRAENTTVPPAPIMPEMPPGEPVILPLTFMGQSGVPESAYPLGKCQGDCDEDTDCIDGLICYYRRAGEAVPGCGGELSTNVDYCVDPRDLGTLPPESETIPDTTATPAPTVETPRTEDVGDFKLKIFWQEGYNWQEEPVERKWCVECVSSGPACTPGRRVHVTDCDDTPDMTQWELVYFEDGVFHIKDSRSDNCWTVPEDTMQPMFVDTCDATNLRQLYTALNGEAAWGSKFEIQSYWNPAGCISVTHHPRDRETMHIFPCFVSRRWTTGSWNFYE